MEKNELDFGNDLADMIEAASPTPDELGRLAARCGIERGSLEGKATEVRIGLLVQSALRDPILVDRLFQALPTVFPHVNKQDLELLYSSRPPSLRNHAGAASVMRETGSASRKEFRPKTPAKVDVLLVVATDIEREAVLAAFKKRGHDYVRESIGVSSCWIYPSDNTSVALVQCRMGSGGPGGSMLTAMEAITALTPEVVIMPGIAFGVDDQKQQIGDVLLSTQILNYELRRMGTDEAGQLVEITRGSRPDASVRLLDRFISARLARFDITVREGLLLSGDKLVDNFDYREELRSFAPEAIGGEMEGAGVYAAAHRAGKEWILAKAICDYADGMKRENKATRQKQAADASANAVVHVLEGLGQ